MKRILIVEDEPALRQVYSLLFKTKQFDVHEASNGKKAIAQLDDARPDVILLDVLMPVMGGIEFLEKSKVKSKLPETKILVLSNLSDPDTLDRIKKLGADKYMLKANVSPTELIDAVNDLLAE